MKSRSFVSLSSLLAIGMGVTACSTERLADIGQAPRLSPLGITPVTYGATMAPMAAEPQQPRQANTLRRPGSRSFFFATRARPKPVTF